MGICRAVPLAALIVASPLAASAQFGSMPGLPGGTPGGVPGVGGFGAPPQPAPPPACRDLLAMRDEVQKHGTAIKKANERKATVQEACKLFRNFRGAERSSSRVSKTTPRPVACRAMRSSRRRRAMPRLRRLASRSAMRRPEVL